MEVSPLETSSADKYVAELEDMLKWNVAILTVLLQEAGGLVEISRETLEGINVGQAKTQVSFDSAKQVYLIEGVYDDGTE